MLEIDSHTPNMKKIISHKTHSEKALLKGRITHQKTKKSHQLSPLKSLAQYDSTFLVRIMQVKCFMQSNPNHIKMRKNTKTQRCHKEAIKCAPDAHMVIKKK